MTDAKTIRFEHYHQWVLLAHGSEAPTQPEWEHYVGILTKADNDKLATGLLVLSDGVGPDSMQRRMLADLKLKTAVVTLSRVARGIATALSWVGANIKAFQPHQMSDVFNYLNVRGDHQLYVLRQLAAMRLELAGHDPKKTDGMSREVLEGLVAESMASLKDRRF